MLILRSLQLTNFLSHANTMVEFKPNQKLLIDGISGSGKSSIVDGVVWGLYGKGRSDNRSLIKHGCKKAEVKIQLEDEHDRYVIDRAIDNKGHHELLVSTSHEKGIFNIIKAEGTKQMQDFIERNLLKSSYLLFINSIVYPQDNSETFINQTAAKRKELLLEMINAATYDEYLETTKRILLETKESRNLIKGEITANNEILAYESKRMERFSELESKKVLLDGAIKELDDQLKILNQEINDAKIAETEINLKNEQIENITTNIIQKDKKILELENKIVSLQSQDSVAIQNKYERLKQLQEEYETVNLLRDKNLVWTAQYLRIEREIKPIDQNFDSRTKELNYQLIRLLKEETPRCHKCKEPVKFFAEHKQQEVDRLNQELIHTQELIKEYDERIIQYQSALKNIGEKPEYDNSRLTYLQTELLQLPIIEAELNLIRNTSQIVESIHNQTNEIKIEITNLEKEKNKNEQQLTTLHTTISTLSPLRLKQVKLESEHDAIIFEQGNVNDELSIAKSAVKHYAEIKNKTETLEKLIADSTTIIESLELLKDAFGNNGIKAIIIDYIIPRLEDRINDILSKLSDFRVRLDTQKTGVNEDTTLEGLFILVSNELGEQFEFQNYSGGEKIKIEVAITEALAEIQKVGFRILDETFTALDEESTEKFAEILITLQQRFSQLVCISHLRNIKDLFQEHLIITKQNGISVINKGISN